MTDVPAICQNCGALYAARVLEGAILKDTKLGGNPIPCPLCGSIGYVVDGLYSNIGNTIQIIASSISSQKQLKYLIAKLNDLKNGRLSTIQFQESIRKDMPEIKSITDTLPKTRSELYAFIAILLTAITILISSLTQFSHPSERISKDDVDKIVAEAIDKTVKDGILFDKKASQTLDKNG